MIANKSIFYSSYGVLFNAKLLDSVACETIYQGLSYCFWRDDWYFIPLLSETLNQVQHKFRD